MEEGTVSRYIGADETLRLGSSRRKRKCGVWSMWVKVNEMSVVLCCVGDVLCVFRLYISDKHRKKEQMEEIVNKLFEGVSCDF